MNRRWQLLILCLLMSSCLAAVKTEPPPVPGQPDKSQIQSSNQLLVMLHMPLPHYRPDSSYSGRYSDDASHSARRRMADRIALQYHLTLVSDWPMPTLGVDCYLMQADGPAESILEQLAHDARIEWAQPVSDYHALSGHDPLYPLQPSAKFWHLSDIHQFSTGNQVRVAVIDSGIDDNHPDLTGQVRQKENFIDNNPYVSEFHGTAVAGIIAARAGNGAGVEGVASNAQLMALRACWEVSPQDTLCNSFTLSKALNFAILHKAQVINLSLAGPGDRLLQKLLEAALTQGITVVAAVDPHRPDGGFPASVPGVLAITDQELSHAGALVTPGRDIPTTVPGGQWGFVNGVSFACAHGSGLVALLLEINPALSPQKIRQQLLAGGSVPYRQTGLIDACSVIAKARGACVCSCPGTNEAKANP